MNYFTLPITDKRYNTPRWGCGIDLKPNPTVSGAALSNSGWREHPNDRPASQFWPGPWIMAFPEDGRRSCLNLILLYNSYSAFCISRACHKTTTAQCQQCIGFGENDLNDLQHPAVLPPGDDSPKYCLYNETGGLGRKSIVHGSTATGILKFKRLRRWIEAGFNSPWIDPQSLFCQEHHLHFK
jgi:hypothetical protein